METPGSIIKRTTAIGFKEFKPTATEQLSVEENNVCDVALSQFKDIMSPKFYAWYCKAWYKIGENKFRELASLARTDGKHPAKLFSKLIKQELNKTVDNDLQTTKPGV